MTNRAKKGGVFAEAWLQNPSRRSRPAAANRLAHQLQPGQAEGGNGLFGRFSARPTPDPYNPGCAGGPRSITALSSQDKPTSLVEKNTRTIEAHDGFEAKLTDKSVSHFTSKHGHSFGIDDPLPLSPDQKPTKYPQTRTRINKANKAQLGDTLEEILEDPISEVFPDVAIRGIQGHGYYTPNPKYGEHGAFIGIATEGKLAGQIIKAQPVSLTQLEILREFNAID